MIHKGIMKFCTLPVNNSWYLLKIDKSLYEEPPLV